MNSRVVQGQGIAQYTNAETGECLTAPGAIQGRLVLTRPAVKAGTKTQEIAFWWSA